jgi:hypothetical protein
MVAALSNNFTTLESSDQKRNTCSILKMEITRPSAAQWYNGIIAGETKPAKEVKIKVVDNGSWIEFVLPSGTAQFAEMTVSDAEGNLIWKTQSYSNNSIIWHKQTSMGSSVPDGRYILQMKQGDILVRGVAVIN